MNNSLTLNSLNRRQKQLENKLNNLQKKFDKLVVANNNNKNKNTASRKRQRTSNNNKNTTTNNNSNNNMLYNFKKEYGNNFANYVKHNPYSFSQPL